MRPKRWIRTELGNRCVKVIYNYGNKERVLSLTLYWNEGGYVGTRRGEGTYFQYPHPQNLSGSEWNSALWRSLREAWKEEENGK